MPLSNAEQDALDYGYKHGRANHAQRPQSDNGTRFTGNLLVLYENAYNQGKQDHQRYMDEVCKDTN